jgi:tetratricopeptide (TPR) repeat protein
MGILGNPQDVLELETDYANLRAALTWLTQSGDSTAALRLAAALGGFWNLRAHLDEGRPWLERTLAQHDGTQPRVRASALLWLAMLTGPRGDPERAVGLLEESLALAQAAGDVPGVASAMVCKGFAALHYRRDPDLATALGKEALALFQEAEVPWGFAGSRMLMARAAHQRGELDQAAAFYEQLLADYQQYGGDEYTAAFSLHGLGAIARAQGNDSRAVSFYAEALSRFDDLGDLGKVAWCLEEVAAASGRDHPEQAGRLFAAADALRTAIDVPLPPAERPAYERAVASVRTALGQPAFDAAWLGGAALSVKAAIAAASDLAAAFL